MGLGLRAADAAVELLGRFAADRDAIIATLLGATDPGPVTAIESGLGPAPPPISMSEEKARNARNRENSRKIECAQSPGAQRRG